MIHLCGAAAGNAYAARGFRLIPTNDAATTTSATYLERVNVMKHQFARLASAV